MQTQDQIHPPHAAINQSWQTFLNAISDRPESHSKWLNTLSLMEHIGSRKIVKALDSNSLDETLLRHIAEEARHAFFFKKLANKISPQPLEGYNETNTFCGQGARVYFQELDRQVHQEIAKFAQAKDLTALTYLAVTTIIETRATSIYKIYDDILRQKKSPISLRSVLAEEDQHLLEMQETLEKHGIIWQQISETLFAIEEPLMKNWLKQLEATWTEELRNSQSIN